MRRNRRHLSSVLLVVLTAALMGVSLLVFEARPKLGLDLKGGLSVVLHATGEDVNPEVLDKTVSIIRERVDSIGAAEPEIARAGDEDILVQLPDIKDRERALEIIGKTAQLRFRPVIGTLDPATAREQNIELDTDSDDPDAEVTLADSSEQTYYRLGPAEVRGDDVADAFASFHETQNWTVQLTLTSDGAEGFADVTSRLAPQSGALAIVLDGVVESAPLVQQPITDGQAQITGQFSEQDAQDLALVLKTGALPISLEPIQIQSVSATLGIASLRAGLLAGAIGFGLVAIYMLLFYRLLGLITLVGLGLFGVLILGIVGVLGSTQGFTLTLAGIAGLIVSVGIAADSYIIYYERVKDELKDGKTFRSAVDRGFQSAFRTNLAGNSVAFAAAIVLYLLAVGPVRGFALTLGISVVIDVLLLYFFTHPIVALVANSKRAAMRTVGMKEAVAAA